MRIIPTLLLFALILLATPARAAPTLSLSLSAGELERGGLYTVTLGITGAAGWVDVVLEVPPGIAIQDIETSGDPELLDFIDATPQRHHSRALVRADEALTLSYTIRISPDALPPLERVWAHIGGVTLDAPARVLVDGGSAQRTFLPLIRR